MRASNCLWEEICAKRTGHKSTRYKCGRGGGTGTGQGEAEWESSPEGLPLDLMLKPWEGPAWGLEALD